MRAALLTIAAFLLCLPALHSQSWSADDHANVKLELRPFPSGRMDSVWIILNHSLEDTTTAVHQPNAPKKLLYQCPLHKGVQQGVATWYYANGRPKRTAEIRQVYPSDSIADQGAVSESEDRPLILFSGPYEEWHDNGVVKVEGTCKATGDTGWIRTGAWQYRFEDGSMQRLEHFDANGRKSGVSQTWYQDGRPKGQGAWAVFEGKSVRHGRWKLWDLEGKLINEWQYERGKRLEVKETD